MIQMARAAVLAACVVALAGCAAAVRSPAGHIGYVTGLNEASAGTVGRADCPTADSATASAKRRFVRVMIPHGRLRKTILAAVAESMDVALGDRVEVAPSACASVVPVVKRVLTHRS